MPAKLQSFQTNAVSPETIPQVNRMRAIQRRAPTFARIRLLGTSNTR